MRDLYATATLFDVTSESNYLAINGTEYRPSDVLPVDVWMRAGEVLRWVADGNTAYQGFEVCASNTTTRAAEPREPVTALPPISGGSDTSVEALSISGVDASGIALTGAFVGALVTLLLVMMAFAAARYAGLVHFRPVPLRARSRTDPRLISTGMFAATPQPSGGASPKGLDLDALDSPRGDDATRSAFLDDDLATIDVSSVR